MTSANSINLSFTFASTEKTSLEDHLARDVAVGQTHVLQSVKDDKLGMELLSRKR